MAYNGVLAEKNEVNNERNNDTNVKNAICGAAMMTCNVASNGNLQ